MSPLTVYLHQVFIRAPGVKEPPAAFSLSLKFTVTVAMVPSVKITLASTFRLLRLLLLPSMPVRNR